tara:strand:+ start:3468 stop:4244 length:777 start_codon:yes stop_codon:yes gene_type:complete
MPELLLNGRPIGKIKAILFDKDGTLTFSEEHLFTLSKLRISKLCELVQKYKNIKISLKELESLLFKSFGIKNKQVNPNGIVAIGSKESNLIFSATILTLFGLTWPDAIDIATQSFQEVELKHKSELQLSNPRDIIPGVEKFLKKLKASGVKCAVISNDNNDGIKNFLSTNSLKHLIYYFWSAENKPTKPNPLAVKKLCKNIGVLPKDCALIGDADSDLRMAQLAGVKLVIGYNSGWSVPPRLTSHQYLIQDWNDIDVQ